MINLHDFAVEKMMEQMRAKDNFAPSGMDLDGDKAVLTSAPKAQASVVELMALYGLEESEWEQVGIAIKQRQAAVEGIVTDLHQLTVNLRRKQSFRLLLPAPLTPERSWQPSPKASSTTISGPRLTLVTTDPQIPFHDEALHQITCQFAHDMQIDEWVELGDFLDLPSLSRFRQKPEFHANLQNSINVGGRVLSERTSAAPAWCLKQMLGGNHDARLRTFVLDHAQELFGLKRAQIGPPENESVLDLSYLLRAAEFGWETASSPYGEYPFTKIEIAPGLVGIHGNAVRPGAGKSVQTELAKRDHSVIHGHVNKLSLHSYVRYRADGEPFTVFGCEAGMLGSVAGGMGFGGPTPDWTQGFVTVTTWPDGAFHIELAPYINGVLRWRDRTWRS